MHHDEVLRPLRGEAEVVGDEQDRGVALLREGVEVIKDPLLHRDVERAGGLVGDEQFRIGRQPDADEHPLAHAAGELVRELPQTPIGIRQSRLLQHLDRLLACSLAAVGLPVGEDGLLHLETDAVQPG